MLNPCVARAAAPLEGFLSYVPEAQEIRDAALAAFDPVTTAASWLPEEHQESESGWTLLAVSTSTSDDRTAAATASRESETPAGLAPQAGEPRVREGEGGERRRRALGAGPRASSRRRGPGPERAIEPTAGAEASGPASAALPAELERTQRDVLESVRLLVVSDQQQQQARAAACRAEEAWVRTRYSATATKEEVKAANRARLAAHRAFAKAWEEYVSVSQVLCHSAKSMLEQEGPLLTL
jgi:hypothetical protein